MKHPLRRKQCSWHVASLAANQTFFSSTLTHSLRPEQFSRPAPSRSVSRSNSSISRRVTRLVLRKTARSAHSSKIRAHPGAFATSPRTLPPSRASVVWSLSLVTCLLSICSSHPDRKVRKSSSVHHSASVFRSASVDPIRRSSPWPRDLNDRCPVDSSVFRGMLMVDPPTA